MSKETSQPGNWPRKRMIKWIAGGVLGFVLVCGGLPTAIYLFIVPSKIELVIGEKLPKTAEVVNSQYDYVPHDPIHRFAIAFTDDQARDLLIAKYKLTNNPSDIMGSGATHKAAWWPTSRLQDIETNGECYGRVDDAGEQWWTLWVDRENNLLYFEAGKW
ncbi:MAG: hypothetical protein ACE37H_13605 [Phycisphaeraceae bacterium]